MRPLDVLADTYAPLQRAWGDLIPPVTAAVRDVAERALAGKVSFYGVHLTEVGRRDIDWSAPQHRHQEWPAQLNRFMYLVPLAALYRETGEARYAEAARDYLTAHGVEVIHLLDARRSEVHKFSRWATVQNGQVIYGGADVPP